MDTAALDDLESRLSAAAGQVGQLSVRGHGTYTFSVKGPRTEAMAALERVCWYLNSPPDWNAMFDAEGSTALGYFTYPG